MHVLISTIFTVDLCTCNMPVLSCIKLPQICDDFKDISYKLRERSNAIEDLTEQREYIKTVPELVNGFQAEIDQAMADYDLIDEYFYPLSDDDFNNRSVIFFFFLFFLYST